MGNCCQCVSSGNVGIVEKLGKFENLAQPGIHCLFPPFCDIVGQVGMRVQQQLSVRTETKTKDNVTIQVQVAVQFARFERGIVPNS
jgi:regulator of protease activity HflC (stomatin/prohibitin superfamily)